jgi:ThiS family
VQITVRLFAGPRELAGTGRRDVELPEGSSVDDVWQALGLGDEPRGLLYAVNRTLGERQQRPEQDDRAQARLRLVAQLQV